MNPLGGLIILLLPAMVTDPAVTPNDEGAGLRSITVEGDDRVQIAFERPEIRLDLDPRQAPGLGWRNTWEEVDVVAAVTARSALTPSRFVGRPWISEFAQDDVVVFHPETPAMSGWTLTIVDSRGKSVAVRQGEGTPPASLAWNGRGDDGSAAWPGLTYSYRLDTVDPAGNRRTTVGRGFDLPAYRLADDAAQTLVFAGDKIISPDRVTPLADLVASPLILAAASWLNQTPGLSSPIEIRATARSQELAEALAAAVDAALSPLVCGDPARVTTAVRVVADAPDAGVVEVVDR
jgi:hypothetical protein